MIRIKLLVAAALLAATAQAAQAQQCRPLDDIITACDAAFPVGGLLTLSARGWCYLIGASCVL
jgi:hypothetical protein